MTVTVYDKPNCRACEATKNWLDRRGIAYKIEHLSASVTAMALAQAQGWTAAPIVITSRKSWSGFRPDLIDNIKEFDNIAPTRIEIPHDIE